MSGASTFVDVLGERTAGSAGIAFDPAGVSIGRGELAELARAVGAGLVARGLTGRRVLVTAPAGIDQLAAVFGCWHAGAVAVPVARGIADVEPAAAIGPGGLSVAELCGASAELPEVGPDTLALLQPSRGRWVMVSHANLLASATQVARHLGATADSGVVSALPPHHDLGLVGGVLMPVLVGCRTTLTTPERWATAMSAGRGRIGFAPPGACPWPDLDLSDVDAVVTSEPADEPADTVFPAYWSPEATSLIAGRRGAAVTAFDADTLEPGRLAKPAEDGEPVADRGRPVADLDIAIVDPLTATRCPDGTAGEVWVSGPNVAVGYLGRPDVSERTFCARLRGSAENYLRTGDFGFVHDGGLHLVTPRNRLLAAS